MSRNFSAEETRNEFLSMIRELSRFWATIPNKTNQERCDGLAFSILNIFDGTTLLPAMNIVLCPHEEDKEFNIINGENWYEDGMIINDCFLHDLYYKTPL